MWIRKSQKRIEIEERYKMYSIWEMLGTFLLSFAVLHFVFLSDSIEGIPIQPYISKTDNILMFYVIIFLCSLTISFFATWYRIKKTNSSEDQSQYENAVI